MPEPTPEERHRALAKASKILESKVVLKPVSVQPEQVILDRLQAKMQTVFKLYLPVCKARGFVEESNIHVPVAKELLNQFSEFTYDELIVLQAMFATNVIIDWLKGFDYTEKP